ncbi:MAG: hypothetical protein J6T16_06715 [Opitutales bacterium]|nr:hypothetical protein [Opitutales bacterium]
MSKVEEIKAYIKNTPPDVPGLTAFANNSEAAPFCGLYGFNLEAGETALFASHWHLCSGLLQKIYLGFLCGGATCFMVTDRNLYYIPKKKVLDSIFHFFDKPQKNTPWRN